MWTKGIANLWTMERDPHGAVRQRPVIGDVGETEPWHLLPQRGIEDFRDRIRRRAHRPSFVAVVRLRVHPHPAVRRSHAGAPDTPSRCRQGDPSFVRYRLPAPVTQTSASVAESQFRGRQLIDRPKVIAATCTELRTLERNRVPLGVVFIIGWAGVGRFGQIVEVRRERIDQRLQATPLSSNARPDLVDT